MSNPEDSINAINLEHSVHILRADGILEVTCVEDYYGVVELKQMNKAHRIITKGKKVAMLFVSTEFTTIDNEGREYMASEEATQYSIAEAYIIKTLAQRILANFYIRINKPKVPTKFFTLKEEAEQWLLSELEKSKL